VVIVKFLSLFLLVSLSLSLFSCFNIETSDKRRFHGNRERTDKTKPRKPPEPELPNLSITADGSQTTEDLVFPLTLRPEHQSLNIQISANNTKITVSALPNTVPLRVVAGWAGQVAASKISLPDATIKHKIVLSPQSSNSKLHFELSSTADLRVSDSLEVPQSYVLAETTEAFTFYVEQGEQLTVLCFPLDSLSQQIQLTGNFDQLSKSCEK